ncbi:MAG: DNA-deoxyinosine glycosylase [Saezia sp.]
MNQSVGLDPVIREDALLVVLGSFPGQASLQARQYYAFSRNQFWPIVGALLGQDDLQKLGYESRLHFLTQHKIGLWDVYQACIREGSLDSNISAGQANDLSTLKARAPELKVIVHNGKKSAKFMKQTSLLGVHTLSLPSTSPAYAGMRFHEKLEKWKEAFVLAGIL